MVDWRGYARFAGAGYATALAVLWLLLASLLFAGFVAGPQPVDDETTPAVDTSEPPNEVATDAVVQLRSRDHTVERWHREVNVTSGEVWGGIVFRMRVDHDDRAVRVRTYPGVFDEGITHPSDPHYEFYGTTVVRWQRAAPGGQWRRIPRQGFVYEADPSGITRFADEFRNADVEVASENRSTLAMRVNDPETLDALFASPNATHRRLVVVIDKRPEPHLARITYTARAPEYSQRFTYRISNVGSTDAPRPDRVAPPRATEALVRSVRGLGRISTWLGG